MNDRYDVYAERLGTRERRYIGRGFGDASGLLDLYADECSHDEEIVLVPITRDMMRAQIRAMVSGLPGSEYQHSIITKVGRDYVHYISLRDGQHGRIRIEDFFASRDLYQI